MHLHHEFGVLRVLRNFRNTVLLISTTVLIVLFVSHSNSTSVVKVTELLLYYCCTTPLLLLCCVRTRPHDGCYRTLLIVVAEPAVRRPHMCEKIPLIGCCATAELLGSKHKQTHTQTNAIAGHPIKDGIMYRVHANNSLHYLLLLLSYSYCCTNTAREYTMTLLIRVLLLLLYRHSLFCVVWYITYLFKSLTRLHFLRFSCPSRRIRGH